MTSTGEIVVAVFLSFIILGGAVGNLLILMALWRLPNRQKPSSVLLMSLALSDFCLAVFIQPYQLVTIIQTKLIEDSGILCQVGGVASYPFFIVSTYTLVGMCVDRFYAVGNALLYRARMTPKVVLAMVIYPWVHASTFGLSTGFAIDVKYDPETRSCGFSWRRRVAFVLLVGFFHVALPFIVLLVSNALLFHRMRLHKKALMRFEPKLQEVRGASDLGRRSKDQHNRGFERKVSRMVISILTVFLVCWTPYVLTRLLTATMDVSFPLLIQTGSVWVLHANSAINPVLYTYFRRDLKTAISRLFCCKRCCVPVFETETASSRFQKSALDNMAMDNS